MKWDKEKTENLIKVILKLKSVCEAKRFFRDLLTEREIIELANRWQAVQMLNEKVSYIKIEKATGLSSRTIARISKWLNNGQGGYKLMLNRISKSHHNSFSKGKS